MYSRMGDGRVKGDTRRELERARIVSVLSNQTPKLKSIRGIKRDSKRLKPIGLCSLTQRPVVEGEQVEGGGPLIPMFPGCR